MGQIMRPFEATGYTKIDQGHAEIAERVVQDNNAPNKSLSVSQPNGRAESASRLRGLDEHKACLFAQSCIAHTDPEVRQVGARIILHMYKNGDRDVVRQYLPPDGSKTAARNPLFKASLPSSSASHNAPLPLSRPSSMRSTTSKGSPSGVSRRVAGAGPPSRSLSTRVLWRGRCTGCGERAGTGRQSWRPSRPRITASSRISSAPRATPALRALHPAPIWILRRE